MRRPILVLSTVVALVLPAGAAADVTVWFREGAKSSSVTRGGTTIPAAVRALLAGPTAPERARGLVTSLPAHVPLLGITIERRVVTVDLGARFALGTDETSLRGRVSQLVRTVMSVSGVAGVRVLVEGGTPLGLFPGVDMRRTFTPAVVPDAAGPTVRETQQLLADLGFLADGSVTGVDDDRTHVAVLGFQKWSGLERDGVLGPGTMAALRRATRPLPSERAGVGRRIEIRLDRQVALLIEDDKVGRVVHISTGAYGRSTPVGTFRVYRKERYSWSVPFKVWMPWASDFTGGIAFHEYGYVPAYPASHGCVRVNRYDAVALYAFAGFGTPVRVRASPS